MIMHRNAQSQQREFGCNPFAADASVSRDEETDVNPVERLLLLGLGTHDPSTLKHKIERAGYAVDVVTQLDSCLQALIDQPCRICLIAHGDQGDRSRVVAEWIEERGLSTQVLCLVSCESHWGLRVIPSFSCEILDEDCSVRCLRTVLHAMQSRPPRHAPVPQIASTCSQSLALAGRSVATLEARRAVAAAVASKGHLLIIGAEGVGKNLLARQIHTDSGCEDAALTYIDCRRNPMAQLSGFFGDLSLSGAGDQSTDRTGELTDSLILDRVDQMPRSLQRKLGRLLRSRAVPVAGEHAAGSRSAAPRIISLSTQPLSESVARNQFDRNLYTILSGQVVQLQPLNKRPEDVADLVGQFFGNAIPREGHGACQLTASAMQMLYEYNWPGNIRELWNVLAQAACLADDALVTGDEISVWMLDRNAAASARTMTLRQMEQMLIESTFARCGGNREDTARSLGIGFRTLSGKLRDYGYPPRGGSGSNQLSQRLKVA